MKRLLFLTFCVLWLTAGCQYTGEPSGLIGVYVARNAECADVLVLKPDSTYVHMYGSRTVPEQIESERWRLDKYDDGYSIGLSNYCFEDSRMPWASMPSIWALTVFSSFGEITLPICPDFGIEYLKISDDPGEGRRLFDSLLARRMGN